MTFGNRTRGGIDVDDYVSSYALEGRGTGVVGRYCGSDVDPLGVSSTDLLCYVALTPAGVQASVKESTQVRYAFIGTSAIAVYCSSTEGVRLVTSLGSGGRTTSALDALAGQVVAWPCSPIVALEADEDGDPLVIIESDGALYSPRPRAP
jgi:hypothetical protein